MITPAMDEEIEALDRRVRLAASRGTESVTINTIGASSLLARIEADRARIKELEAERDRISGLQVGSFRLLDRVQKTKGSSWQGRVVGFYSTALTPAGIATRAPRSFAMS